MEWPAFQPSPSLVYVLSVVAGTWVLRQAMSGWITRRGLTARQAVPIVAGAAATLGVVLVGVNVALGESWRPLLFNLFVVAVQAGALLLTLRLAEAAQAYAGSAAPRAEPAEGGTATAHTTDPRTGEELR